MRFASGMVPVGMNKRVVWTRYYTPREFYGAFAQSLHAAVFARTVFVRTATVHDVR